jgi:hypothetical protein
MVPRKWSMVVHEDNDVEVFSIKLSDVKTGDAT